MKYSRNTKCHTERKPRNDQPCKATGGSWTLILCNDTRFRFLVFLARYVADASVRRDDEPDGRMLRDHLLRTDLRRHVERDGSNHGVRTMRGCSSSMYPRALGTMKPTQSMSRTLNSAVSSIFTVTACSGINFGSVVMMVRPEADCGSSSTARSRAASSSMFGMTVVSINFLMKVDLPGADQRYFPGGFNLSNT